MIPKRINDWFKEHSSDENEYLIKEKQWNGFNVYSVDFKEFGYYGSPTFIIEKDNKIRFANYEEAEELVKFLYSS